MNLTKDEKAARYDALQTAIKYTIDSYGKRQKTESDMADRMDKAGNRILSAVHVGMATTYESVIEDLNRWI